MAKPLAVLIVEDVKGDAQLIVRLLTRADYSITFELVETAAQMRAALEKQAWEIVISDYSLPEFDGHAALMLLRETGLDIPFIVVSGMMGEETAVDMMKAGAHDYVMKGNLARLVPAVERELIQAEVRRERRRAEEALRESEERYRQIIETAQEGIWTVDAAGRTTLANQRMADMLGYTVEEMMGKFVDEFLDKEGETIALVDFGGRQQENKQFDFKFKRKDGSAIWALVEASTLLDHNYQYMGALAMLTDITGRKQAEEKLRETNEILQALVQASPVSIVALDLDGNVKKWNPASQRIFGWSEAEVLGQFLPFVPRDKLAESEALRRQVLGGKTFTNLEVNRLKKDGIPVLVSLSCVPLHDGNGRITGMMGVNIDITERKRAEEALRASEQRYRQIIETAQEGIWTVDAAGRTTLANQRMADMFGYTVEEMMGKPVSMFLDEEGETMAPMAFENRRQGINKQLDFKFKRKDGSVVWTLVKTNTLLDHNQQYMGALAMLTDITERKQAEEKLAESKALVDAVLENVPLMIFLKEATDLRFVLFNRAGEELLGCDREALLGKNNLDLFPPEQAAHFMDKDREVLDGEAGMLDIPEEPILTARKGQRLLHTQKICIRGSDGATKYLLGISEDITERKLAEEQIRQRLSELEVLYQSGLAFSQLITPQAIAQKMIDLLDQNMNWHHTVIRLYHPESETLELLAFNVPYLSSREERSAAEKRFRDVQRLDQGLSGWVVQQAQVVRSNDLRNDPRYLETFPGLQSGLYVPIKIAERVIGVISIESERPQAFNESDERLAITLAAQAAIAMDNAQLFESLRCSNVELASAYDATIEGWSRALDLRDKETEGHSLRVTEMTLRLAQSMGISEEELVHVRRGALLHDIGKMGVPDGILFKPGPLTDEEWVVMKKHPALAYEMLSPILYLQRALDIPYCHHEKWDGSGYPRGLKDTQIPLGARIFAIVDVWDALSSDRPYRARWAKEKVDEHIRLSSGAHFDPQVVDAFLQMPH
jgi:PAS domain S-box-containing protein/putative nucleotidyltransferase with HDIG domain